MKEKATIYDLARLEKSYGCNGFNVGHAKCEECPLNSCNNKRQMYCGDFKRLHLDEANEIILKWRKEHPHTYKDDFREKFPNCDCTGDEGILICRKYLYGGDFSCNDSNCKDYWNEEMPDEN